MIIQKNPTIRWLLEASTREEDSPVTGWNPWTRQKEAFALDLHQDPSIVIESCEAKITCYSRFRGAFFWITSETDNWHNNLDQNVWKEKPNLSFFNDTYPDCLTTAAESGTLILIKQHVMCLTPSAKYLTFANPFSRLSGSALAFVKATC